MRQIRYVGYQAITVVGNTYIMQFTAATTIEGGGCHPNGWFGDARVRRLPAFIYDHEGD